MAGVCEAAVWDEAAIQRLAERRTKRDVNDFDMDGRVGVRQRDLTRPMIANQGRPIDASNDVVVGGQPGPAAVGASPGSPPLNGPSKPAP